MKDYRRFLQPNVVAQLDNMEMKARLVVEGFITGLHRSPYHGFSVEFAEHRQYRPGDAIKHIDWKVLGRTDKYYVKQFEEETNLRSMVILDSSASMGYASKGMLPKFEYASYLAAALAYLLINQRDAVGLALYDTEVRTFMPARSRLSFLHQMLKVLDSAVPANETGTAVALDKIAEKIKRRGLVIILSDFFDEVNSVVNALKHFRHKDHDVLVFHILDPREVDFKFGNNATFKDLETGEEMVAMSRQIQKHYKEHIADFINNIRTHCRQHNIDYQLVDTSQPFDKPLKEYLAKRAKL